METKKRNRASAVILKDEKVLLIERVKPSESYYVFPGGGIEEGESPEAAVVREVKEETNLDAKDPRELFFVDHPEHGGNHVFLIEDFSGSDVRLGGPEAKYADESNQFILGWVSVSDLDQVVLYPEIVKGKVSRILKELIKTRQ